MSENIVKNQHFVPRFYLSRFLNENNEAEVLDCERREIISPRGPKGVCCEEFFYGVETGKLDEVSQGIEKGFKEMEDAISKVVPEFLSNVINRRQITAKEKWEMALLMSMLWTRGPAMRARVNSMSEDILKQTTAYMFSGDIGEDIMKQADNESGIKAAPEVKEACRKMMENGEFSVEFNNQMHLMMFEEMTGYANLFAAQHWTVYISKASKKFVTSDNPVAMYIPEQEGWFGPTFLERTHYFALSPDICIKARHADNKSGKNLIRKTLFEKDSNIVSMLNLQISNRAHQYVYSKSRDSLEDILEFVRLIEASSAGDGVDLMK
jgi:hypothetical protein